MTEPQGATADQGAITLRYPYEAGSALKVMRAAVSTKSQSQWRWAVLAMAFALAYWIGSQAVAEVRSDTAFFLGVVLALGLVVAVRVVVAAPLNRAIEQDFATGGDTSVRIDKSGVRVRNANSELFFPWTAFDRWIPIRGGTVLVFRGPWGLGVPDTALP
ncbi:MAG: hypothetical protein AAGA32_22125, partial [Pseudomonadota bacterium]